MKTKRVISFLLALCMAVGVSSVTVAAAEDWFPWEVPTHTKAYTAKYEIVVESWDYTEYEADINGKVHALEPKTVQADKPYSVGPLDTTLYQLENGNYWFNQLYQHRVGLPSGNNPYRSFVGFNAEYLIRTLLINGEFNHMYNTGLFESAQFTVQEKFLSTVLIPHGSGNFDTGAYGAAFELNTLPAQVRFTMTASDSIPTTHHGIPGTLPKILNDYSFLFRGVIKFTDVQEIKASNTIFGTRHESTPWNWIKFIFLFGWIWMWF